MVSELSVQELMSTEALAPVAVKLRVPSESTVPTSRFVATRLTSDSEPSVSDNEIVIGEIVRLIDGPLAPLPCLSRVAYRKCRDCRDEATCVLRRTFATSHDAAVTVLDRTSLAGVLASTEAPPSANRFATARPIPVVPVTRAIFPENPFMQVRSSCE